MLFPPLLRVWSYLRTTHVREYRNIAPEVADLAGRKGRNEVILPSAKNFGRMQKRDVCPRILDIYSTRPLAHILSHKIVSPG